MGAYELDLLREPPALPEGMVYRPGAVTAAEERALLEHIGELPLEAFEFHGYMARRRTYSFGWHYDFGGSRLERAHPLPAWLLPLRDVAADVAGVEAERLPHALILEYAAGATIGWHRDKAVFDDVVGFSLLAPCRFRLRRKIGPRWDRASLMLAPRSAYLLHGPSRTEWEHSIPAVDALRYSITFRSLVAEKDAHRE